MAGMLPGVECARRRRLHQGRDSACTSVHAFSSSSRRSSFCLYASSHESHLNPTSSLQQRISSSGSQGGYMEDEKLGGVAREAKERLDERLRAQWKSDPKRKNSQDGWKGVDSSNCRMQGDLQREVYGGGGGGGGGKSGKRMLIWGKYLLRWKASEQEECAICLEPFSTGETLSHPPCAHRFHSRCLDPWLKSNAHCPCCRITIFTTT